MLETHLLFLPYWHILDLFIAGIWTRPPQNGQKSRACQGPKSATSRLTVRHLSSSFLNKQTLK